MLFPFAIAYGTTMEITAGTPVWAESALGERLGRVAATAIVPGLDFPVVWICEPEEWATAQAEGREPISVPWPAEAVSSKPLSPSESAKR